MSAAELIALSARCETVAGPDRELEHAIEDAMKGPVRPPFRRGFCPAYTASLDAAMTLALDGWDKAAQDMGEDGGFAEVWRHGYYDDTVIHGNAATAALALCAAALRACAQVQS